MDDRKNRSGTSRYRRIGESRSRRPIRFAGHSVRFVRYLFEYRTPKTTEIYKRVRGEQQNKESICLYRQRERYSDFCRLSRVYITAYNGPPAGHLWNHHHLPNSSRRSVNVSQNSIISYADIAFWDLLVLLSATQDNSLAGKGRENSAWGSSNIAYYLSLSSLIWVSCRLARSPDLVDLEMHKNP